MYLYIQAMPVGTYRVQFPGFPKIVYSVCLPGVIEFRLLLLLLLSVSVCLSVSLSLSLSLSLSVSLSLSLSLPLPPLSLSLYLSLFLPSSKMSSDTCHEK